MNLVNVSFITRRIDVMGFGLFLFGFVFCLFNLVLAVRCDYSDLAITVHMIGMLINYILILNVIFVER